MRRTSRQGSERRSSIANFPRVLTEDAQEPDHRPLGRVWHALDERAVAHGAARRQARRFRSIAHVHCRNRLASGGVVTESATSLADLPGRDDGTRSAMPALCHHHGLPCCRDVLDLPIRLAGISVALLGDPDRSSDVQSLRQSGGLESARHDVRSLARIVRWVSFRPRPARSPVAPADPVADVSPAAVGRPATTNDRCRLPDHRKRGIDPWSCHPGHPITCPVENRPGRFSHVLKSARRRNQESR
jgi:hypothetical protein